MQIRVSCWQEYSVTIISAIAGKQFALERVEQLKNAMQKPTSRDETIAVDWSLR
ncbi:MAG: hypothetical protein ABIP79_07405 [Chitinophagaceae bacterium]